LDLGAERTLWTAKASAPCGSPTPAISDLPPVADRRPLWTVLKIRDKIDA
jgi:hypothetical protein